MIRLRKGRSSCGADGVNHFNRRIRSSIKLKQGGLVGSDTWNFGEWEAI